jgi:transcriptional regulator with XRE-family HTH domain
MTVNQLAKESGVDRMTITKLEKGGSRYRDSTVGQLTSTLDRLEHELGFDLPAATSDLTSEGLVEISVAGDFGVSVIVKGPVRDIAELEAAASRLLQKMQAERRENDS